MNESIPFLPGLSPVAGKKLCARFDGGRLSSDGGVLLLREVEHGLAEVLASCLADERDPSSTRHSHADMRLLAVAPLTLGRAEAFVLAQGDLQNPAPDLPQNRLAFGPSLSVGPGTDRRQNHGAGAMNKAACAAC